MATPEEIIEAQNAVINEIRGFLKACERQAALYQYLTQAEKDSLVEREQVALTSQDQDQRKLALFALLTSQEVAALEAKAAL